MAIDSSALNSINNAIASYSNDKESYNDRINRMHNDAVQSLAAKAVSVASKSRYQSAFEEKMKTANGSADTVDISKDSLEALKKYNSNQNLVSDAKKTSSSSGYTYDYQAIKKKNLENQAAIEKDVSTRYGKNSKDVESEDKASENKGASAVASQTAASQVASSSASSVKDKAESQQTASTTQYSYDYFAMKEKDQQKASSIQNDVNAQYSGKSSPDSIVG
ncbi:MAG: hypothetical protein ACI4UM_08425 [Succinivibrio sp.]